MFARLSVLAVCLVLVKGQSDADIQAAGLDIWTAGEADFFTSAELQYDTGAGGPLFTFVDEGKLYSGTYGLLIDLFQYYTENTGTAEQCDSACENAINAFLDAVIASAPMQEAKNFINQYDSNIGGSDASMRDYVQGIFFTLYTRSGGPLDSSGFEHVLMGEIDEGELKGYHGWEKTYLDEQAGDFVYGSTQAVCEPDIPKFDMSYKGYAKDITSVFLKTTPEVEMALYTICFRFRSGQLCDVELGAGNVQPIQTYSNTCSYSQFGCIGSAYPRC